MTEMCVWVLEVILVRTELQLTIVSVTTMLRARSEVYEIRW